MVAYITKQDIDVSISNGDGMVDILHNCKRSPRGPQVQEGERLYLMKDPHI